MGDLTLNKIFGAILAMALGFMGLHELSHGIFAPAAYHGDDHHGEDHEEKSLNEQLAERYAYYVEVAETSDGGGGEPEEVFDLAVALASADIGRGERAFQQKCASCHQIGEDGGNSTGPALWNIVGKELAFRDDFNYSNGLSGRDETWTYENLNDWLYAPALFSQGTTMSFAGLRRDDERVNVIAYMAAQGIDAPAFPVPVIEEPPIDEATPDEVIVDDATPAEVTDAAEAVEADAVVGDTIEAVDSAATEVTEAIDATESETDDN